VRDRKRLGVASGGGELGCRLEAAEEVGLLKDHASGVRCGGTELVRVGRSAAMGYLDDFEGESSRVRLHDVPDLRIRRLGDDDPRASGRVLRDEARVGGDRCTVIARRVRDVHAGQLADRGLVLEDRLQDALAELRLIRRVRGQELAALEDGVDDRGNVVVVDARAEERELASRVDVAGGELREVGDELRLGQRRVEIEFPFEAHAPRQVGEQVGHGFDADRIEHRRAIALGEREVRVGHCSARSAR
jgi:hypothetical protein